jgi:hypothetical protein
MVASLARPGGNATSISVQSTELAGKRSCARRSPIWVDWFIGDVGYAGSVLEISEELRTKYS